MYDVIIAGAGVAGAFIARELSKYELNICILEKGNDVASGASKANSGIVHAGFDCSPGSLKALLNVRGAAMMEDIARELDVSYKRTGSLVVGFGENDRLILEKLMQKGRDNGVEGMQMLDRDRVKELEPHISDEVTHALYAPSAGIICPYELTAAAVENAVINGAELRRNSEVTAVRVNNGGIEVETCGGVLACRYFINAAGVYSDRVAAMAGDYSFVIKPRKGEYLLMDKTVGNLVSRVVFQCPTAMGKGILLTPTVDGNLMIGPDAQDVSDPEDCSTTEAGLVNVLRGARRAVPGVDLKNVITSFAGLRARLACGEVAEPYKEGAEPLGDGTEPYGEGTDLCGKGAEPNGERTVPYGEGAEPNGVGTDLCGKRTENEAGYRIRPQGDFLIAPLKISPRFINVAGIESPGLSCAPAIGEYVCELLGRQGLRLTPRKDYRTGRDKVVRFRELQGEELDELLRQNPSYGRLVCRCEKVTEGEIVDCIRRPAGALDLDAVKRRTRAGMGRCQGGFCTPRLVDLLSRELGIPYEEVTKKGGNSWLLAGRSK